MPLNEADTCRTYVLPKLYSAGWEDAQISEQKSFTDGRIVIAGSRPIRRPQKRADYILRYRRDFPIAVVEAKAVYRTPGDGLQQAKEYAQILGLKFAYATRVIVPPRSIVLVCPISLPFRFVPFPPPHDP